MKHLRLCICPSQLTFDLTSSVMPNSCVVNVVKTHMIVTCLASLTNTCRRREKRKKRGFFSMHLLCLRRIRPDLTDKFNCIRTFTANSLVFFLFQREENLFFNLKFNYWLMWEQWTIGWQSLCSLQKNKERTNDINNRVFSDLFRNINKKISLITKTFVPLFD